MSEKSITKIQVGNTLYHVKDDDLWAMVQSIAELEDLDTNATTEEIAEKINSILGHYRMMFTYTIGVYDAAGDFYLKSNFTDNFDGTATVGVSKYGDVYYMEVE